MKLIVQRGPLLRVIGTRTVERAHALQQFADHRDVFGATRARGDRARVLLDQPHRFEPRQRFAQRHAAHVEAAREFFLAQRLPRHEHARHDVRMQLPMDHRRQQRRRDLGEPGRHGHRIHFANIAFH
jgi:hypothetical protein